MDALYLPLLRLRYRRRERRELGPNGAEAVRLLDRIFELSPSGLEALVHASERFRDGGAGAQFVNAGNGGVRAALAWLEGVGPSPGHPVSRFVLVGMTKAESAVAACWSRHQPAGDVWDPAERFDRTLSAARTAVILVQLRPWINRRDWAGIWAPFQAAIEGGVAPTGLP